MKSSKRENSPPPSPAMSKLKQEEGDGTASRLICEEALDSQNVCGSLDRYETILCCALLGKLKNTYLNFSRSWTINVSIISFDLEFSFHVFICVSAFSAACLC